MEDANAVAESEPLVRPFLYGLIERGLRNIYVSDGGDGPTYVQGVLIPQLHAVIQVGDVVEVRILDLAEKFIYATIEVGGREPKVTRIGT